MPKKDITKRDDSLQNGNIPSVTTSFTCGEWLVRPDLNQLRADDRRVSLEPRVMQLLVYLINHQGEVVPRQQLQDAIWQDTIVGKDSLNRAVCDLRRSFDDDSQHPEYIETIRKVGYRLVAPVSPIGPAPTDATGDLRLETGRKSRRLWRSMAGLAAAIGLCAVVVWLIDGSGSGIPERQASRLPIPLTSEPGLEVRPAISPDGTRIAYSRKENDDTADIYIGHRDAATTLRLTDHPGYENYPTWSPDGKMLAIVRATEDSAGIYLVPAAGGQPRCVYHALEMPRHLDWSPDGDWIVFSKTTAGSGGSHLVGLDLRNADQKVRQLTVSADHTTSDIFPRFSPAGDTIAFIRKNRSGLSDIFCINPDGSNLQQVTHGQIKIWGLAWSVLEHEIYFASYTGGPYALSAVSLTDRTIRRTQILSEWVRYPTLARDAACLVYESRQETQNVMALSLDGPEIAWTEADRLIASNGLDTDPSWSPDGRHIVFVSDRSGHGDLWICNSDGSRPRQLTQLAGPYVSSPMWSPDGRQVVFLVASDVVAMYLVDVAGGPPRQITQDKVNVLPCSWSRDGKMIYYAAYECNEWQIWQVGTDGNNSTQVTSGGGIAAIESPDGSQLYHVRPDRDGIWRQKLTDNSLECVVSGFPSDQFRSWTVNAAGIFHVRPQGSSCTVLRYDLLTGTTSTIATIPSYPTSRYSISPDGSTLLFVRSEHLDIDLKLLDYLP